MAQTYAEGGGGYQFEYWVGAYYLAAMFGHGEPQGGIGTIEQVRFQRGSLGDVVVYGMGVGGRTRLDLQVKSKLSVSGEHGDFPKVVRQIVELVSSGSIRPGVDQYGIAVRRKTVTLAALSELADRARANDSAEAFQDVHDALNGDEVTALHAVTTAVRGLGNINDVDEMVWRVLGSGLVVLELVPDNQAGRDRALLNSWIGCRVSDPERRARILTELYAISAWRDRHGGSLGRPGLDAELLAKGHRLTEDAAAPLVLTLESMDTIRTDHVVAALPSPEADRLTISVRDLVNQRLLRDPEAAVERIVDPNGPVARAIEAQGERELVLAGSAHIPLAALVGFLVGNRGAVGVIDWHPNSNNLSWQWPERDDVSFPSLAVEDTGDTLGQVAIRISLSFWSGPRGRTAVMNEAIHTVTGGADRVIHLFHPDLSISLGDLQGRSVRSRAQSLAYATTFRQAMNATVGAESVHVFYAGPLSVAFEIGRNVQETFHPPTTVWNYVGGHYPWGVELNPAGSDGLPLPPRAVTASPPAEPARSGGTLR